MIMQNKNFILFVYVSENHLKRKGDTALLVFDPQILFELDYLVVTDFTIQIFSEI